MGWNRANAESWGRSPEHCQLGSRQPQRGVRKSTEFTYLDKTFETSARNSQLDMITWDQLEACRFPWRDHFDLLEERAVVPFREVGKVEELPRGQPCTNSKATVSLTISRTTWGGASIRISA